MKMRSKMRLGDLLVAVQVITEEQLTEALAAQKEDDKVARYYIKITEDFFIKGKYPTEHDDAGVAFNPEDRVFKLMQK